MLNVLPKMDQFLDWLNIDSMRLHPIRRAAMAHFLLLFAHPFGDGNGARRGS
jgi:Fic family protein